MSRVWLVFNLVDDVRPTAYPPPQEGHQTEENDDSRNLTEGADPREEAGDSLLLVLVEAASLGQGDHTRY